MKRKDLIEGALKVVILATSALLAYVAMVVCINLLNNNI
jgi:hypothetical protein